MLYKNIVLILFAILILTIGCSDKNNKITEAEAQLLKLKEDGKTAGVAITLTIKNEIVWSKGYGLANIEQQTPVYPSKTRFRIASISKALTGAGLGVLMAADRIDVDLPITHYLSYYPEKKFTFSTRLLAGHLAGIRGYIGKDYLVREYSSTVREGLNIFIDDPLIHEPGTKYSYSSYGSNLLSAVIESAANTEFLDFMDDSVFTPIGMKNTVADLKDTIILYRSGFYSIDKGLSKNTPYVDNSYKWAGGGYLSTSEDIVKFGNAILYNKLFPESIKTELITTQYTTTGDTTNYGMGWGSGVNNYGRAHYGHGGSFIGGSGKLLIYPNEELVVAYLTNNSRNNIGKEIHDMVEIFLKEE